MAHAAFEQTIFVDAAPETVIAHLSSYAHHDAIHPMIVAVRELDAQTNAEGAELRRYAITDRMRLGPLTLRFTYLATISGQADGRLISDAYQFPRIHLHNVTRCLLEGAGTRVEERVSVEAPRLLIGVVARQAEQAHREMLANLAMRLAPGAMESRAP